MVRCRGNDAVFEGVAGFEAEDADRFDADVLVSGGVDNGGIGRVGDGAGEDVGCAAAGVGDADQRDFDLFERAVEVEIQAGELASAEFVIDFDAGVDFLAAVAVGFEADAGFEEFDFGGQFWRGFLTGFLRGFLLCSRGSAFSGLWRRVLQLARAGGLRSEEIDGRDDADRAGKKSRSFQDDLEGSLGREGSGVKRRIVRRCAVYTSEKRFSGSDV